MRAKNAYDPKIIAWVLSIVFGGLHHYQVFERDVPFHTRVGEEIVKKGHVVTGDFWSYTTPGQIWFNHEWFSTVINYAVASVSSHGAFFPTWRAILSGVIFWLIACIIRVALAQQGNVSERRGAWVLLTLIPAFYIQVFFQMRPEIYAVIFFSGLILLWVTQTFLSRKIWGSIWILLLWVNFHGGTVPFGIFFVGMAVLTAPLPRFQKAGIFLALPLIWLCSPIGIEAPRKAFSFLGTQAYFQDHPDLRAFNLGMLRYRSFGVSAWFWITGLVLGLFSYFKVRKSEALRDTPYSLPLWFWTVGLGLMALAFHRIRAMPYLLIFLIPVLTLALVRFTVFFQRAVNCRFRERSSWVLGLSGGLLAMGLTLCVWQHFDRYTPSLGFGWLEGQFPEGAVDFIRAIKPQGRLFHDTNEGGFLMDFLREYPVFDATSGDLSTLFTVEKLEAGRSREALSAFLAKYQMNTALFPYFKPTLKGQNPAKLQTYENWFASEDWALVYFDRYYSVLIRRIPAHSELIQRFAYRQLLRTLPDSGAKHRLDDPVFSREFRQELERCRAIEPDHPYCVEGLGAYH